MNIISITIDSIVCLAGTALIVFNRRIGAFADRFTPRSLQAFYFPRVNAFVIGALLIVAGILGLVDDIGK